MFNVGILAAHREAPVLVKLSNREIPRWYYGNGYNAQLTVALFWGQIYYSGVEGENIYVPGEWLISGATPPAGVWQMRITLLAGSAPSNTWGYDWVDISAARTIYWDGPGYNIGGRVLLEIREAATGRVHASAQIWTSNHRP